MIGFYFSNCGCGFGVEGGVVVRLIASSSLVNLVEASGALPVYLSGNMTRRIWEIIFICGVHDKIRLANTNVN